MFKLPSLGAPEFPFQPTKIIPTKVIPTKIILLDRGGRCTASVPTKIR